MAKDELFVAMVSAPRRCGRESGSSSKASHERDLVGPERPRAVRDVRRLHEHAALDPEADRCHRTVRREPSS